MPGNFIDVVPVILIYRGGFGAGFGWRAGNNNKIMKDI
jgi:hypothetical protein